MDSWLTHPCTYEWVQRVLTRRGCWDRFVKEYLRPIPGERLLDLGCGVGRLLDFLPPMEYWGLDSNPAYIRFAQKNAKESAAFVCADLNQTPWPVQGPFDRVAVTGVLHHLSDSQALDLLKNAKNAMKPRAKLVTFDGCFEARQSPFARMLLSMDRGKHVRTVEGYTALARSVFSKVHTQIERRFLRVPYTHLIMEMTAD